VLQLAAPRTEQKGLTVAVSKRKNPLTTKLVGFMLSADLSPFPSRMLKSREVSARDLSGGHQLHQQVQGETESKPSSSFPRVGEEKPNPWHDNCYVKGKKV